MRTDTINRFNIKSSVHLLRSILGLDIFIRTSVLNFGMMKIFVFCLLIKHVWEADGMKFEKFRITQGVPSTAGIRCVLKYLKTPHAAFWIRDEDGECKILNQSWVADKTYYSGFTYLEKSVETASFVFQSFTPPDLIGEPYPFEPDKQRVWAIPGRFGVGGRIELYFSTPLTAWNSLQFRLFDSPAGSSLSLTDDVSELLFISITMSKEKDEVRFKSYDSSKWNQSPRWTPFPFDDGHAYKCTIEARQDHYQILFDGIERAILSYVGLPETAKTLAIRYFKNGVIWPYINNITFYGV